MAQVHLSKRRPTFYVFHDEAWPNKMDKQIPARDPNSVGEWEDNVWWCGWCGSCGWWWLWWCLTWKMHWKQQTHVWVWGWFLSYQKKPWCVGVTVHKTPDGEHAVSEWVRTDSHQEFCGAIHTYYIILYNTYPERNCRLQSIKTSTMPLRKPDNPWISKTWNADV